jgi:hypothetical protein
MTIHTFIKNRSVGHRYSIDFDMFFEKRFGDKVIINTIEKIKNSKNYCR